MKVSYDCDTPGKAGGTQDLLNGFGVGGMTGIQHHGLRKPEGVTSTMKGAQYQNKSRFPRYRPRSLSTIELVEDILVKIHESLTTGKPGDGKVFV